MPELISVKRYYFISYSYKSEVKEWKEVSAFVMDSFVSTSHPPPSHQIYVLKLSPSMWLYLEMGLLRR